MVCTVCMVFTNGLCESLYVLYGICQWSLEVTTVKRSVNTLLKTRVNVHPYKAEDEHQANNYP